MFLLNNLLAPVDSSAGSGGTGDMSKGQVINFLGDEEEDSEQIDLTPPKEEKKAKPAKEEKEEKEEEVEGLEEKEEESEEIDELKELEDELEEPGDEQLELVEPVRRREILAKYPALFKDFPYLERAYYREQKFTELLPTIDDAKEAVSKAKTLDSWENSIKEGDTETVLKIIKDYDKNTFNKVVDDYLPTLAKVDREAHLHVIGDVIKETIIAMVKEANESQNDALKNAAAVLNQFVFASSKFEPPQKLAKPVEDKDTERENQLKMKERELTRKEFEKSRDTLNNRIDNILRTTVKANIDPKQSMTDYVRRNAERETLENLQSLIEKDTRFSTLLDKLWERAFTEDFSQSSIDRIKTAYLSKAKTLLPSVIKKARNEALKGLGKRVREEVEEVEETETPTTEKPKGRSTSSSNSGKSEKGKIPAGMSSREYLMQD